MYLKDEQFTKFEALKATNEAFTQKIDAIRAKNDKLAAEQAELRAEVKRLQALNMGLMNSGDMAGLTENMDKIKLVKARLDAKEAEGNKLGAQIDKLSVELETHRKHIAEFEPDFYVGLRKYADLLSRQSQMMGVFSLQTTIVRLRNEINTEPPAPPTILPGKQSH